MLEAVFSTYISVDIDAVRGLATTSLSPDHLNQSVKGSGYNLNEIPLHQWEPAIIFETLLTPRLEA